MAQKTVYLCDSVFHTEYLEELQKDNIVIVGHVCVVSGQGFGLYMVDNHDRITTIFQKRVDLPKEHGRGGQSQKRFERLAEEARHNCIRILCERLNDLDRDIECLVFAGSADMKSRAAENPVLHHSLRTKIIKVVTTASDFERGAREALQDCRATLLHRRLDHQRNILGEFNAEVSRNPDLWIFGITEVEKALELGVLDKLLIHQDFERADVLTNDSRLVSKITTVSRQTEEAERFRNEFGGCVGKLYYTTQVQPEE